MNKFKVIYIIGDNRSGSTLLDYLLSSHPDAVSLGEVHHIYGHFYKQGVGKSSDWKCSCGQHIENCEFWSKILKEVSFNKDFKTRLDNSKKSYLRKWNIFFLNKKRLEEKEINKTGKIIARNRWEIYKAVAKHTGKNIIIDSSKNVDEAYFLNKYKKGDIQFILLNRDIHEVALSKINRTKELQAFYKKKENTLFKTILSTFNIFKENHNMLNIIKNSSKIDITKAIDYKELTLNPQKEIDEICSFLDILEFQVPKETNVYKTTPHILGGSPSRYKRRPIKPDIRWKDYYKNRKFALTLSKLLQRI